MSLTLNGQGHDPKCLRLISR